MTENLHAGVDALDVDQLADQLLDRADADQAQLLGTDGLLTQLTQRVLNRALDVELAEHLGYEKGDPAGRGSGNNRNGSTTKTVLTDVGAVAVTVPRDRNGSFEPKMVPKYARRLAGFNEQILQPVRARDVGARHPRAPGRDLWRTGQPRSDLQGHRRGHRGDHHLAEPAPGPALAHHLHRRPLGEDQRRRRRQSSGLPRGRGRPGRLQAHPGLVDRPWGGRRRSFLDERARRAAQPRRGRCADLLLRRALRPASRDHRDLAAGHGADLIHPQ